MRNSTGCGKCLQTSIDSNFTRDQGPVSDAVADKQSQQAMPTHWLP